MTPAEADRLGDCASAYVHIPFCSAVCPYCDFAVVAGKDDIAEQYIEAVVDEIGLSDAWRPLDSVFFGGGTPSHVAPSLLGRVLDALADHHGIIRGAEITLEANPEDFNGDRARELLGIGFNRVSFGAQSFDETVLANLGRRHRPSDIASSVGNAREAGFANISLDLIFGTPGETGQSWVSSLEGALAVRPDHVSCYSLTVEPGTPLHRAVRAGAPAPDPDEQADRYEQADLLLSRAGLERYEVSNWSLPGHECRYNLTVWAQGEYEAYGNGAHRFRNGVRSHNVRRLEAYVDRIRSGNRPTAEDEHLVGWDLEMDRLFVGLRRSAGVADGPGVNALFADPGGQLLAQEKVVERREGRLMVTRPLLTDEVHRRVLGLEPPEGWDERSDADNL